MTHNNKPKPAPVGQRFVKALLPESAPSWAIVQGRTYTRQTPDENGRCRYPTSKPSWNGGRAKVSGVTTLGILGRRCWGIVDDTGEEWFAVRSKRRHDFVNWYSLTVSGKVIGRYRNKIEMMEALIKGRYEEKFVWGIPD